MQKLFRSILKRKKRTFICGLEIEYLIFVFQLYFIQACLFNIKLVATIWLQGRRLYIINKQYCTQYCSIPTYGSDTLPIILPQKTYGECRQAKSVAIIIKHAFRTYSYNDLQCVEYQLRNTQNSYQTNELYRLSRGDSQNFPNQ